MLRLFRWLLVFWGLALFAGCVARVTVDARWAIGSSEAPLPAARSEG